jgi:hypothetical protein
MSLLNLATTVCIGPMVGTELAVSVFINPVILRLEEGAQARTVRMFAARLGMAMPFWYVLGLLLLLAEAVALRHAPGAALLDVAAGIWALVIVLTLLFLVPINNRMARMEAGEFGKEAQREHRKWDSLHRLRVAALGAAMVCFLVAIGV